MYHVRAYSHRCEFCSVQNYFGEHRYFLVAFLVGVWWNIKGYAVFVEKVM